MLIRFDFRVTPRSMAGLFIATVIYVVGVRNLLSLADWSRLAAHLTDWFGLKGAVTLLLLDRALETLLFVVFPFRTHIRERCMLVWITLAVSFGASVATTWLVWGLPPGAPMLLFAAHLFAAGIFWLFIWKDESSVTKEA